MGAAGAALASVRGYAGFHHQLESLCKQALAGREVLLACCEGFCGVWVHPEWMFDCEMLVWFCAFFLSICCVLLIDFAGIEPTLHSQEKSHLSCPLSRAAAHSLLEF